MISSIAHVFSGAYSTHTHPRTPSLPRTSTPCFGSVNEHLCDERLHTFGKVNGIASYRSVGIELKLFTMHELTLSSHTVIHLLAR